MISLFPRVETWNVQSIDADGLILGPGPVNSFNVFFYADNAGLPGTQVYSAMNQSFSVSGSTFTVNLAQLGSSHGGNVLGRDPSQYDVYPQRRVDLDGSHCAVEPGRSLAKSRRWLWYVPHLGSENNMHSHNRRTRPGVPAQRDDRRRHSNSHRIALGDRDSYSKWYSVVHSNAKWHDKSHSDSKCYRQSFGDSKRNSKCYRQSFGDPSATPSATGSPSATATPSPSATATPSGTPGVCVRGQGYWKNHPEAWPVTELQLGNVTYTQQQLLDILHEPVRGNGLLILAHQLIAAKLNIAAGADPSCIEGTIAEADALIGDLVIPPVGDGYLAPREAAPLAGHSWPVQ